MTQGHKRFAVFLSYNGSDRASVEAIAHRLRTRGIEPWLDSERLIPGTRFQAGIADGLEASSTCAVFLGPNDIGNWQREEIDVGQDLAARDPNFRIMPVLLPGVPDPLDHAKLPRFLAMRTWVDFRKGTDDALAFQQLVLGIAGGVLEPRGEAMIEETVLPYRSLEVFDEEHAELFHGREGDTQRLLEKLKASTFLAVLGPSGSGKSSLVRAGLVPALRAGKLKDSETWVIRKLRPTASPLAELAGNLNALNGGTIASKYWQALFDSDRTLYQESLPALTSEKQKLVWIVDQFEEVFTLCPERLEAERARFIANLVYPATVREGRVIVVLTMRADFYFKIPTYPSLATSVTSNQFLVSPMLPESLKRAIEQPAMWAGYTMEPALTEVILQDVTKQPGVLPLLEYALAELWERRNRTSRKLTLEAYQEIGGVKGALAKRAESVYAELADNQQIIARRILLRLTQPGEGAEDTRRTASFDELVTRNDELEEVEKTLGRLVDARLLTTSGRDFPTQDIPPQETKLSPGA